MKIKSLKKLSFLFVFALILSVIPSISVSAASYDRDFVAIKKVKLWVQNSHAYKRGEVKLYCLEGESPVLETQVKGLTKGNKYNIEVTLYKDGRYVYSDSLYGTMNTAPLFVLPELEAGRYMVAYSFSGDTVVQKDFNYEIDVMKEDAFNYTSNLFANFGIPTDEVLYSFAYQLSDEKIKVGEVADYVYLHFKQDTLTDEQFVKNLYKGLLYRDYDEGGYYYWLGKLQSKELTRSKVFEEFVGSYELEHNVCEKYNLPY